MFRPDDLVRLKHTKYPVQGKVLCVSDYRDTVYVELDREDAGDMGVVTAGWIECRVLEKIPEGEYVFCA
ncbi:MAG: hypothetical protein ACREBU_20285 [Nitrososphaera sp.]